MNPRRETSYSVTVTSKMMHDYRESSPSPYGFPVAIGWTADGNLRVLALDGQHRPHVLQRDVASPTGWIDLVHSGDHRDVECVGAPGQADHFFSVDEGYPLLCLYEWFPNTTGALEQRLRTSTGNSAMRTVPFGADLVSMGVSTHTSVLFVALLPPGKGFAKWYTLRHLGEIVRCTKGTCLPQAAGSWPLIPVVVQHDRMLAAYRGTGLSEEEPPSADPGVDRGDPSIRLDVEAVALPPLAGVMDFAVAATSETTFLLLAVDGTRALHAVTGTLDAEVPGLVHWDSSWTRLDLTGDIAPSFTSIRALRLPDGRVQVLMRDGTSGNLWITGWGGPGLAGWVHAVNLAIPCAHFSVNLNDHDEMVFATSSPTGISLWSRDLSGDWRPEEVSLPAGPVRRVPTYRAGICVTDEFNAGVSLLPARVSADDDIVVVINGVTHWIGEGRAALVSTDGAGRLAITTEITNTLHAPTIVVEGDFLADGSLGLRPDRDVQGYLRAVAPAQLLEGTDPLSGVPILAGTHHNQGEAEAVSQALAKVCGLVEHLYEGVGAPEGCPIGLAAQRGVRYLGASAGLPRSPVATGEPWSFGVVAGRAVFRTLSAEEAERIFTEARLQAEGFLGIDWGSLWESVKSTVSTVVELVVDGVKAAVRFVLNGVEYLLDLAIETLGQVFDLVTAIFDIIGTLQGTVIGWLLKVVGFLFGWDEILEIRDRIKAQFREQLMLLPTRVSDPATLAQSVHDLLEQMRTQIRAWIADIERMPIGSSPFREIIGSVPALPSYFEVGGNSFLEQATWLVDKVIVGFGGAAVGIGVPDIPGLSDAFASLRAHATGAGDLITSFGDGLWQGGLSPWIQSLSAFESGTVVPVLSSLPEKVAALVDFLEDVLGDLIEIVHLAYAHMGAVVDWVDHPIYIPFLSAFYSQVVGSDLTMLDLASLAIAIPLSISGDGLTNADEAIAAAFWALVHGLAEGLNFKNPQKLWPLRVFADLLQVAVAVPMIASGDDGWKRVGLLMAGAGGLDAFFRANFSERSEWAIAPVFEVALLVFWIMQFEQTLDGPQIAVSTLVTITTLLSSVARVVPDAWRSAEAAVGFGVLQGALAASIDGVWLASHATAPDQS